MPQSVTGPALSLVMSIAVLWGCTSTNDKQLLVDDPNAVQVPVQTQSVPTAEAQSASPAAVKQAAAELEMEPAQYRLGPQDLLEIQVFEAAELSGKVRVSSSGFILLPLLGQVKAEGLTHEELAAVIAAELARDYLQDPHVTVFILEYANQRVTVMGAVQRPGVYQLTGPTTVVQAVALAGGMSKLSSTSAQLVRETPGGRKQVFELDMDAIRSGKQADPFVKGGDVVMVDKSSGKAVAQGLIDFVVPFRWFITPYAY